MIRRIAITGPESTGKSMLAEHLAGYYRTVWVPEYAREYLETLGRPYEEPDILAIAKGQLDHEEEMTRKAREFLFCDTELIVTKVWSDDKFHRCDPWILEHIQTNPYDLYLLCDIDLPWEYDPMREDPDRRQYLFDLYTGELKSRKFPYSVIRGYGENRLNCAVKAIENCFK